jgi:hypothetical protein
VLSRAGAGDSQPLADPAEATDLLEWRLGDGSLRARLSSP